MPECALLALLDADKEGFLPAETSLIQTNNLTSEDEKKQRRVRPHKTGRPDPSRRFGSDAVSEVDSVTRFASCAQRLKLDRTRRL